MKRRIMTVLTVVLVAVLCAFALAGCGSSTPAPAASSESSSAETEATITVGATVTPHSEILEQAKPLLAEEGITLEIVEVQDYVTPNTGVDEGSLDANFFQHQPYLDNFNDENGTDIVSIGSIHYEPFGVYAGKVSSLDELQENAQVAVPNDVTNEARALLLLEQEGILKLKEDAGINATVNDIVENPLNIEFVEVASEQLVRALEDVDVAVINGNYAIEGGLKVADALAVESDQGIAAKTYANIIACNADRADDPALLKLVEILQGDEIQKYITDTYEGAVLPMVG